jgi:hypothetical protein
MLNLQPGVHLKEVKITGLNVKDKLHGTHIAVLQGRDQRRRGFNHILADLQRDKGRWRLLNYLLISTPQGAVALTSTRNPSCAIAKDMHLNVPCTINKCSIKTPSSPKLA